MVTHQQTKRNNLLCEKKMAANASFLVCLLVIMFQIDEAAHSPHTCDTATYFQCDGRMMMCTFRCDTQHNCVDGTDEEGCDIYYAKQWPTKSEMEASIIMTPADFSGGNWFQQPHWYQIQLTTIIQVVI